MWDCLDLDDSKEYLNNQETTLFTVKASLNSSMIRKCKPTLELYEDNTSYFIFELSRLYNQTNKEFNF